MSAWTVYWLFQLDSIGCTLSIFAWIALISWCSITIFKWFQEDVDEYKKVSKVAKSIGWPMVFLCVLSTIIPSTKTMAAIIVLPRIASAENLDTVASDAGDIYKLAMSRLKDALGENTVAPK